MSELTTTQLRRAFGALEGRQMGRSRPAWPRPVSAAVAGVLLVGGVFGYLAASREPGAVGGTSEDSLHATQVGGSVGTYSGDTPMRYPQSLAAITTTSATALALSAAFICESANAQQAVQWRVEDGGNGHWYQLRIATQLVAWSSARDACVLVGGHLATPTSQAEDELVYSVANQTGAWGANLGPWLGGYQDSTASGYVEPAGGWRWVTGEPWSWAQWTGAGSGQPDNGGGGGPESALHYLNHSRTWNDVVPDGLPCCGSIHAYVIEWSADCNSDGIVDYGQILASELDDANTNNIPDCCEQRNPCGCPADVIENGVVDSIDLSAVLGTWGTNGGDYPRADINHDGIVAAEDLGSVLAGWGACP